MVLEGGAGGLLRAGASSGRTPAMAINSDAGAIFIEIPEKKEAKSTSALDFIRHHIHFTKRIRSTQYDPVPGWRLEWEHGYQTGAYLSTPAFSLPARSSSRRRTSTRIVRMVLRQEL